MAIKTLEESVFQAMVRRELFAINSKLAALDKRLAVAEGKPEEVLRAIEKIWKSDPEVHPEKRVVDGRFEQ